MTHFPCRAALCAALCAFAAPVFAGSVTIDDGWVAANGTTVSGSFQGGANADGSTYPAVRVTTRTPVTITHADLTGPGDLISADSGSNVTVAYTTGTGPGGASVGNFLTAYRPANLLVHNCDITGVGSGIGINGYGGNYTTGNTFVIQWNRFRNINGQTYRGARANEPHTIQIGDAAGVPGIDISQNEFIQDPYVSYVNDVVNIYSSGGTSGSHANVHHNYVQGLFSLNPTDENSGVGVICDGWQRDSAASATQWVDIHDNVFTQMANSGVAIDSGHDNHAWNNTVISHGRLADERTVYATVYGNGITEYDPSDGDGYQQPPSVYYGNSMSGNTVGFMRGNGQGGTSRADAWLDTDTGPDPYGSQHWLDHDPTIADENAQSRAWAQALAQNGWWVGNDYVINPSFESGNLAGWQLWSPNGDGDLSAAYAEDLGVAQDRHFQLAHWRSTPYAIDTYQALSVPNGSYTLTAWVEASDAGIGSVYVKGYTVGNYDQGMSVGVPQTGAGAGDWRQITIPGIPVATGQIEFGVYTQSGGGQWVRADNVKLSTQADASPSNLTAN